VIVATGYEHTPTIPDWPGRESFQGQLLHAAEYRNAAPFRDEDVLVVGPGCSGVEIAYDLAEHGARRVRLAVRTPPTIVLRLDRGVPGDIPAILMMRAPIRFADAQLLKVSRKATGDLSAYGLAPPEKGPMTRLKEEGKAPAIVDKEMIEAIRQRKIEIVTSVETLDGTGVTLANGDRIEPDAIIAATGYRCGLEPLVGHLGVLDGRGVPLVVGGGEAAPGLRFVGYVPRPGQIRFMGHEARRVASEIRRS
jgi:cation diffusion facilitator CzcD-associated flavoprotein CzcO